MLFPNGGCWMPNDEEPDAARAGRVPGSWLGDGVRARGSPDARTALCKRVLCPAGWGRGHRRDRLDAGRRGACLDQPGGRAAVRARVGTDRLAGAGRGTSRGISRGAGGARPARGEWDSRIYPDILGRLWAALECDGGRRRAACPRSAGTSSSTGAAPITSAAEAMGRCAAETRWGPSPLSIAARMPAGAISRGPAPMGASPMSPRSSWIISAQRHDPPPASSIFNAHAKRCIHRPPTAGSHARRVGHGLRKTGNWMSWSSSRWWVQPVTSST